MMYEIDVSKETGPWRKALHPAYKIHGSIKNVWVSQGQAREYGRITHFLPLPLEGHYFQRATVTQWLNRFQISGYQMKDMNIVFLLIPHGLL